MAGRQTARSGPRRFIGKQKGGTPIGRHSEIIKAAAEQNRWRRDSLDATGERLWKNQANKFRGRARGGGISFRENKGARRDARLSLKPRFPTIHLGGGGQLPRWVDASGAPYLRRSYVNTGA